LQKAVADAHANRDAISEKLGKQYGAIFAAHAMLVEDPELLREIEALIHSQRHTAEYAVSRVIRRHAKALESLADEQFSTRTSDLFDIEKSILRHLLGAQSEGLRHLRHPAVVLAHDLTPSETAQLDPKFVYAFATEAGGRASHTAIMAGVLEIPAVVGLGHFLTDISGADEIIVDGNRGVIIIDPDEETRESTTCSPRNASAPSTAASPSCATSPPRPRTASASRSWATSSSPRKCSTASTAAPRASACTAPSSFT
jgi:phosphotransferase system enzyme I (PtsI)